MSHAATSYTFRLRLKPTTKLIALAFADCANPDGTSIRPSIPRVVQDSCTSEQTVRRAVKFLVHQKLLIPVRAAAQHRPVEYRMPMDEGHPLFQPRDGIQGSQFGTPDKNTEENANESTSSLFRVANLAPLTETARPAKTDLRGTKNEARGTTAMAPDPSIDPSIDPSGKRESPAEAGPPTPEQLVELWNTHRTPGPKVGRLTPERHRRYTRALTAEPVLADWVAVITWLNAQAYANAPGTGDHATWRADLDFLARPGKLAELRDKACADAAHPPRRPRRAGDLPSEGLTPVDRATKDQRLHKVRDYRQQQDALHAEAAALVLTLSDQARAVLERDAMAELEPYRERLLAAQFDAMVLAALPHELIKRADSRPLAAVVSELEGKVVGA